MEPVSRARIRAGRELQVIDVSSHGALVEGDMRLLPGTHVDVHIVASNGRVLVRSRIVRAYVASLSSDRVLYRGGVAFEQPIDISHAAAPHAEYVVPDVYGSSTMSEGIAYPTSAA